MTAPRTTGEAIRAAAARLAASREATAAAAEAVRKQREATTAGEPQSTSDGAR